MSKLPYTIVLNKHILVNKILFSIVHCESGPFRKVPNIGFTFEVNRYKRDSYPHYIGGILSLHWAYKLWRFYGDTIIVAYMAMSSWTVQSPHVRTLNWKPIFKWVKWSSKYVFGVEAVDRLLQDLFALINCWYKFAYSIQRIQQLHMSS